MLVDNYSIAFAHSLDEPHFREILTENYANFPSDILIVVWLIEDNIVSVTLIIFKSFPTSN